MVLSKGPDGQKQFMLDGASEHASGTLSTSAQSTASSLRVAGLWLLLLGLGGGALVWVRRKQKQARAGKNSARLNVVERVSLGGHRELLLIQACDRLLVVGVNSTQMSLLSDLPTEHSPSQPFAHVLQAQESAPGEAFATPPPPVQPAKAEEHAWESWPELVSGR